MNTIYWLSTSIVAAFLFLSTYTYLFSESTIEGIRDLGFPDFFRIQLALLKLIGAIVLLLPFISAQVKEWAYAGTGLFFLTALVAHLKHQDSVFIVFLLLFLFVVLSVSNIYMHKIMA